MNFEINQTIERVIDDWYLVGWTYCVYRKQLLKHHQIKAAERTESWYMTWHDQLLEYTKHLQFKFIYCYPDWD